MAFNQNEWVFPITEAYNPDESYMVAYARWIVQQQSLRTAVAPITGYLYPWIIRLMPGAGDYHSFDVNFRLALGLMVPIGIALLFVALLIWVILRAFGFSNNECIDKTCKDAACHPLRRASVDPYFDDSADSSLSSKEEDQDEDKPKEAAMKSSDPLKKPKKKVASVAGELKLRNRNVLKTVEKPAEDEETEC
ncbi:unnamed protein product, partial [Mesorhabditis belari]|uniref:Uncharacterized protein n=1 Tax=Mesorhabditis belari TaxID=2138241 RepID=A0AAF3J9Z2_9BILA